MISLNGLMGLVKQEGFHIYQFKGRYEKLLEKKKALYSVPEKVWIDLCLNILRDPNRKNSWGYFMVVLNEELRHHNANSNIEAHERMKKEPVRLKITLG